MFGVFFGRFLEVVRGHVFNELAYGGFLFIADGADVNVCDVGFSRGSRWMGVLLSEVHWGGVFHLVNRMTVVGYVC